MPTELETTAFLTTLARELRRLREESGLSKAELSNRSGITRQAIRMIENGDRTPSVATLWLIAEGLGVPASRILANLGN